MALRPAASAEFEFAERAARFYAKLMRNALADREAGLGGRLFYAGELDAEGRALVTAANIAGAATLTATGDSAAQKQALRDGIVDFLVTSLDESLRILKNQLRKRETVAVCVALPPTVVESEMRERGVQHDLARHDVPVASCHEALLRQEGEHDESDLSRIPALVSWRVDSAPAKWLPKLDEIALECLDPDAWPDAWIARRWLRLSPRYLGRMARNLRLLDANCEFAARFFERVQQAIDRGEFPVAIELRSHFHGVGDGLAFVPDNH